MLMSLAVVAVADGVAALVEGAPGIAALAVALGPSLTAVGTLPSAGEAALLELATGVDGGSGA